MYSKTFNQLSIGDTFETATGKWQVYDKGNKTLLAYKLPRDLSKDIHEQLIIFFTYDFPEYSQAV